MLKESYKCGWFEQGFTATRVGPAHV